jgi:hypothetical protein
MGPISTSVIIASAGLLTMASNSTYQFSLPGGDSSALSLVAHLARYTERGRLRLPLDTLFANLQRRAGARRWRLENSSHGSANPEPWSSNVATLTCSPADSVCRIYPKI